MTYQEIRQSIGDSFGPYEVRMSDGAVYEIPHTLNMAVNPSGRYLLFFNHDEGKTYELPKENIEQVRVLEAEIESN